MKVTAIWAAAPIVASATVLRERQQSSMFQNFVPNVLGGLATYAKVASVENIPPKMFPKKGVTRTITKYGPYTMSPDSTSKDDAKGGHNMNSMGLLEGFLAGESFTLNINKGFCNHGDQGCTVFAARVTITLEDGSEGSPAKGTYIHHILTSNIHKTPNPFLSRCADPSKVFVNRAGLLIGTSFIGTGEDAGEGYSIFSDENMNTGYHLNRGDSFIGWAMLVNYNKAPLKFYVTYDVEWVPGIVGHHVEDVLISIEDCPGKKVAVSQTGPIDTLSDDFTFLQDGRMIFGRGHMHEGADYIDILLNGKSICVSRAIYGGGNKTAKVNGEESEMITTMSLCDWPVHVKKGDRLQMNSRYDLKKHPLRLASDGHTAGVMGMLALTFDSD